MKTTLVMLIAMAVLSSCTRSNKAAVYQRKIKAYQDSSAMTGEQYYTEIADLYSDSLSELNYAKIQEDHQVKDTASNTDGQ